jgi:hypothetical protein
MSIHTVQIGKTRFVCGLFWQSLSRPRDLWKEAVQLAQKIDADLVVLRKDHAMAQAGYVHSRDGVRRGQQSLAAVISKTVALEGAHYDGHQQPAHNWLCAVRLPDGMWAYCAVRDANFLPNGDFAGSRDEVLDRLQGDYALGGWNVVIGDPELEQYGFHNFSAKALDDLLPKRKDGQIFVRRWSTLHPVHRRLPPLWVSGTGAAALLLLAGAAWFWQQHQRQQEQERARALEAERASLAAANANAPAQKPWLAKPLPLEFARACQARQQPMTPGGWQLDLFQCDPDTVSFSWLRNDANIAWLHEQVPAAKIAADGNHATDLVALKLSARGADVLIPADDMLRRLHARSQPLGVALKLTPAQPSRPPAPNPAGAAAVPPPAWKSYTLQADLATLTPLAAAALLDQAGLRLERIRWRAGAWSIEGVVYVK